LSCKWRPCAAPSPSLYPHRRPGAPHRGLSHHQNPWRRCCCPWEECGPAPASARERTRRASGAVVAALFWGSRAAPAGRYCDGLSQQPRVKTCGFQTHSHLSATARAFSSPRRARLARCQGSFLLWTGSARRVSAAYIREGQPESIKRGLWTRPRRVQAAQRRSRTPGTCLQAAVPPQGSRARRRDHDGPPAPVVGRQRLVPCGPAEAERGHVYKRF